MNPDIILGRVQHIERDKWHMSLYKISRLGKFIQREHKGSHWHQRDEGNKKTLLKGITTLCLG